MLSWNSNQRIFQNVSQLIDSLTLIKSPNLKSNLSLSLSLSFSPRGASLLKVLFDLNLLLIFQYLTSGAELWPRFMQLLDGPNLRSPVLRKLCGSSTPAPLVTPGSYLTVVYRSRIPGEGRGFRLSYETRECSPPTLVITIDYRCDNRRFWLSANNCQIPTPTSQNLEIEQQVWIFGAD